MLKLADKINKVKNKIKPIENELFIALVIISVGFISFDLGRLSKIRENKTPITIENLGAVSAPAKLKETEFRVAPAAETRFQNNQEDKLFVASKNGTKYHYPWCSGALNIKEENKMWFSTKEEAEKSGYTPASNCKGL